MIDEELLKIIACPLCKSDVKMEKRDSEDKIVCQNPECGLIYSIREEIPVMLIEKAEKPDTFKLDKLLEETIHSS